MPPNHSNKKKLISPKEIYKKKKGPYASSFYNKKVSFVRSFVSFSSFGLRLVSSRHKQHEHSLVVMMCSSVAKKQGRRDQKKRDRERVHEGKRNRYEEQNCIIK